MTALAKIHRATNDLIRVSQQILSADLSEVDRLKMAGEIKAAADDIRAASLDIHIEASAATLMSKGLFF